MRRRSRRLGLAVCACCAGMTTPVLDGSAMLNRGSPLGVEHRLPHAPNAPGLGRQVASGVVRHRLPPERADEFVLMVSEIVSNAVRHGEPEEDGQIGFRLEIDDPVIRAVVSDGAPQFSYATGAVGTTHLGLNIVDRLADRWGLERDGRKAVWFEVESAAPDE